MIMYENKKQNLDMILERIKNLITQKLEFNKNEFKILKSNYILNNPLELYKNKQIKLDNIIDKLELINPLNTLKRGYTLTYKDNNIIKNVDDLKLNDKITTRLESAIIESQITNIMEVSNGK